MHARLEDFYGGVLSESKLQELCGEECDNEYDQILRFHEHEIVRKGWTVYKLEGRVVHDSARVCGSIDALFYDAAGGVHMVDWKRSGEIRRTAYGGKRGKPPFERLPDCNWGHYAVQQNIYKAIIERYTSLHIESMRLAVFHPAHSDYEIWEMPDLQPQVTDVLERRAQSFEEHQ